MARDLPMSEAYEIDAAVIGAGVVGLAIAARLAEAGLETVILEKNGRIGEETSARNSEVIHAGLYYPEGSLKGRFCVEGRDALYEWCAARGVPHARLGKLIVATSAAEEPVLEGIAAKAEANGAGALQPLTGAEARRLEPALNAAAALLSPLTGAVDSHAYMLSLLGAAEDRGAALALETPVLEAHAETGGVTLITGGAAPARLKARIVVNAAGLWAQDVAARIHGLDESAVPEKIYYKGNYFALEGVRAPFSRLIYPAPQKGGLGVHLTLDLAGGARFGPDVEPLETTDPAALNYEVDPHRGDCFYEAIRRYWPELPDGALRADYSGVRPKHHADRAADYRIDGPEFHGVPGLFNLFGIESPGLTSSLAIGRHVAALASQMAE